MKKFIIAAAGLAAMTGFALAAEPIEGNWRTQSGETASITNCGGAYCITLKTGKHAGKRIGKVSGSGAKYSGTVTDPADDKTYSGSARVNGSSMKLKGCAYKVFCKTQIWGKL
jgi:uncharacterized protein (DUF2147 family)